MVWGVIHLPHTIYIRSRWFYLNGGREIARHVLKWRVMPEVQVGRRSPALGGFLDGYLGLLLFFFPFDLLLFLLF
jgi:hypothetical protein